MAGTKRSGRKRKPAELRVLEGTFRKDRHGGAPGVVTGVPEAPGCVTQTEQQLWATFPKPAWIGQTDVVAVHAAVSIYERILRNQQAQQATSYGWVDQKAGVVRLPVQRAMELTAERYSTKKSPAPAAATPPPPPKPAAENIPYIK